MIYLLLILQQFLASTTHIFAKTLTSDLHPSLVLFYRSFFAMIFYLVLLWLKKQKIFVIKKGDLHKFILLAILNIPLNQFLFFISIKFTTAPNVALAYALSPIFILIIANFFLKEKTTILKIVGILLAITGIVLILIEKGISLKSDYFLGNLLALFASICWAIYSTYGKPLIRIYGSIYTTAMAMILGFFLYLPIFLIVGNVNTMLNLEPRHWFEILYLAVMTSGFSYLLWYYALKRLPASNVGVFNNLQPVFTTILAVMFLGQHLTNTYLIGGMLVIVGVTFAQINHVDAEPRKE